MKTIDMKKYSAIPFFVVASLCMVSCFDKEKPNFQYMPDMYEPVGYETYGEYAVFRNNQEAMLPAEGSIPRGWMPYEYENTTAGLELARAELKNPLKPTEENLAAGNELYTIYCAVCHGDAGDGQGVLAQREKFLGIPSYADPGRNITEGSIYHVETYGLNAMGSYASQTSEEERWQIALHVMELKAALTGQPVATVTGTDSTAVENSEMDQDTAKEDSTLTETSEVKNQQDKDN